MNGLHWHHGLDDYCVIEDLRFRFECDDFTTLYVYHGGEVEVVDLGKEIFELTSADLAKILELI
jgi:hypothetical protein